MEHFDAIGQWRDNEVKENEVYEVLEIDARGVMPDRKRAFDGHEQLKAFLMEDQDQVTHGFLKSILTYALGRRVGFSDGQSVEDLQVQWKESGYGMRSLIHCIVQSNEFQSK